LKSHKMSSIVIFDPKALLDVIYPFIHFLANVLIHVVKKKKNFFKSQHLLLRFIIYNGATLFKYWDS